MHNWKSPPSRFRGPSPPLLGIHSQSFTWPACTTTGHPLPAIYVAPQAPAPPLLGIQPSRLRGPSAATGYPLPAISAARPRFYCMWASIYVAPFCHYWVSNPATAATGYPLPAIYVAPFCHYWVSNPATAATGYPLPAIYVAPQAPAPPLLGIQPSRLRGPSAATGYPLPAISTARLRHYWPPQKLSPRTIWRNGPYIGGHLAFSFQIEF